ncbi:MAG: VOC family protein [Anaerolineae bacterium]|nr:VOC family protein [Anaerolineae bacterium]
MHIEHIAIWTRDLERLKAFYETYFGGEANDKYANAAKQFESYFLAFASGARLELMQMPAIPESRDESQSTGYAHLAFSVGSEAQVDALTARLQGAGYQVASAPRRTGDGYYESCVLDPDGNRVEITV